MRDSTIASNEDSMLKELLKLVPFHEMEPIPHGGQSRAQVFKSLNVDPSDRRISLTTSGRTSLQDGGTPLKFTVVQSVDWKLMATTCALCDHVFKTWREKNGDHNHTTGEWRGVLCQKCNICIGWLEALEKSSEWLKRALKYLDK